MTADAPYLPESDPNDSSRLRTGNFELDSILWGGFPADSINILMGEPGTGKTLLAEGLLFRACSDTVPGVFLTTLSEPFGKVIRYLQQYDFFAPEKLGTCVHYQDIGERLVHEGISSLVDIMREIINTYSPKLIVVDSLKVIHDLTSDMAEIRSVVHELGSMLTNYSATTFFIGEYTEDQVALLPEFAIADGITLLTRERVGEREDRFIRVLKMRGSGFHEGQHAFEIGRNGLRVYPRLVTPERPPDYKLSQEKVPFGVEGVDDLLHGGLYRGSTTLLTGPTGCGKTTAALQFALEDAERALYVTFQEHPNQLSASIRSLRKDGQSEVEPRVIFYPPVELHIDRVIVDVFNLVGSENISRLVIDAVGDLATAATGEQRFHDYMYSLTLHLSVRNVTTLLVLETEGPTPLGPVTAVTRISQMVDNIMSIGVERGTRPQSHMQIVKTRGSAHDPRQRQFQLDEQGLRFLEAY